MATTPRRGGSIAAGPSKRASSHPAWYPSTRSAPSSRDIALQDVTPDMRGGGVKGRMIRGRRDENKEVAERSGDVWTIGGLAFEIEGVCIR